MKNILIISLLTIMSVSCCPKYELVFPTVIIELRDSTSGEDLFVNGTYIIDSVSITNSGPDEVNFQFTEEQNSTLISLSPSQEQYIFSVGSQLIFDITIDKFIVEKRCYSSTKVSNVWTNTFKYEATGDESQTVWNLVVFVN